MHADDNRRRFVPGGLSAASVISGRICLPHVLNQPHTDLQYLGHPAGRQISDDNGSISMPHMLTVFRRFDRDAVYLVMLPLRTKISSWGCASRTPELR